MTVSVTHAQQIAITTSTVNPVMALAMSHPQSPGNSSGSDTDPTISSSSATTALRRLYFKSGRNAKTKTPTVPKVVVMGSSTTSEVTINTSTESASTLVTNVTATDTETTGTLDSLDLGDTSGQSEPLLSSSLDEPLSSSIISQPESNSMEKEECNLITTVPDTSLLINYEEIPLQPFKTPRTAPLSSSTRFPFDLPASPKSVRTYEKNQTLFTFDEVKDFVKISKNIDSDERYNKNNNNNNNNKNNNKNNNNNNKKRKDNRSSFFEQNYYEDINNENKGKNDIEDKKFKKESIAMQANTQYINSFKWVTRKDRYSSNNKINSAPAVSSKDKFMQNQKLVNFDDGKDTTMFPFDREAIDYERIQNECFAVEEDTKFPFDFIPDSTDFDPESPIYEKPIFSSPSKTSQSKNEMMYSHLKERYDPNELFYQYTLLSQQEHHNSYERRPSKRNKQDMIHSKFDHISKTDAFSPKPDYQNKTNESNLLSRFDQIASRFDQIQPKSSDQYHHNHHHHQHHLHHQHHHHNKPDTLLSPSVMSRSTPPLPDLRIDFFAETTQDHQLDGCQKIQQQHQSQQQPPQQQQQQQQHNSGAINVTANPLDTPVCTQPRATIVVQQVRFF